MQDYQKQLAEFDAHLILKNYSKATRSAYGCALRQFFAYRKREGLSGPFTQAQAREYILYRYKQGMKWQTINGDYSAMDKLLQHQTPRYFQRVRHYGLHAGITYAKIKDQLPDKLKRNGQTVRTVIQILRALLAEEPYKCEHCGGGDFDIETVDIDRSYLARHVLYQGRGPPSGQADKADKADSASESLSS